jgi:hypothetical protein
MWQQPFELVGYQFLQTRAGQPAHAADRLPCRVLKGSALGMHFLVEWPCHRSCFACCDPGFSVARCLHSCLVRHGGG